MGLVEFSAHQSLFLIFLVGSSYVLVYNIFFKLAGPLT